MNMTHFALLWKARTIEKYRRNYENEKHNSIIMSNAEIPDRTLFQRWRYYRHDVQRRLSRKFSKWYPEGSTMSNFVVNFRAEMKFPHILLRSLFGFIGGLLLTYLCFVFLVFQLSLSLLHATMLSSLFGVLVTLGLTFSNRMRCLVFLLIPQLFSRAGRYTLTCYALVLLLTGPATNTLKNSEVLTESMACSQEQIKTSVREINQSLNKPYNSIKESITLMVKEMKRITLILRSVILRTNRLILSFASVIQSGYSWLGTIAQSWNNQLGTPYNRCLSALKTSVENCKESSGKASWYYAAASVARVACGVLKSYEKFCVASDFAGETFYATVRRKLKTFTARISEALFLKIRTRHSYTFIGNTSSPSQVAAGIVTEIRNRADPILTWLSWSSCVTSLFLLLIIFRAKYYQHMYDTRSRFDNRYITKEFRELDLKRLREGRETVLPLSRRERAKYVTTTSFRLVASEKIYLNRSAVFMTITTFKLLIHMVADYSLYWVLMTIRYHGELQSPVQSGLPKTGAHITGTGFVSRLLQALLDTLNIPLASVPSPNSCLPNPHPPDFKRYSQIGTLIILLWIFGLFEPYGLRLRHLIMGHYKPERAKTRAAWLYNHILRTRASFMKFARRKLHREYKYCSENKLTFRYWLRSVIPFQWLQCLLGVQKETARCLLCNSTEDPRNVNSELIRCQVPNCPGTYCMNCFSDIGQMCTICLSPADYGDLSDVSLEKGSSDEDEDSDGKNDKGIFNKYMDSNDSIKKYHNIHTKYESDTESESSSTNLNCETSRLVSHHIKMSDKNSVLKIASYDRAYNSYKHNNGMPLQNYCSKLNVCNFELANIFTEMDRNFITNNKQCPYVLYSFYRIDVLDMSLVVTKYEQASKLANILRKKIARNTMKCTKSHHLFVRCNDHKRDETKKAKNDEQKKEVPNYQKNLIDKKKSCNGTPNKKLNEDVTKKPSKTDRYKALIKKSSPRIERFHSKCSKYWKNISDVFSCTESSNLKKKPAIEERKHKRKKKHKNCKDNPNKPHRCKNNNEDARRFRISSYLADQDWKKKNVDYKAEIGSSLRLNTHELFEENEIEVNHIKIPRLNLNFSSESLNNQEKNNVLMCTTELPKRDFVRMKNFEMGSLDRLIKRSLSSIAVCSSKLISNKREKRGCAVKKSSGSQSFQRKSGINILSRGMKYFRSLGNDFGQETHGSCTCACNEYTNTNLSKSSLKCKSEHSEVIKEITFNKNVVSIESINNAVSVGEVKPKGLLKTKIIKVEPTKSRKSLSDLTKKWSNIKRQSSDGFLGLGFKGPLAIIKDLYTSLFTVSDSTEVKVKIDESTAIETMKETSDKGIAVYPCVQSFGCQNTQNDFTRSDRCVQVERKVEPRKEENVSLFRKWFDNPKTVLDVQVDAVHPTCTCATQCYTAQRDVGTLKTRHKCRHQETSDTESSDDSEFSLDSDITSSLLSDGTLTNTTVCSLATIDYRNEARKTEGERRKRIRVKVVTKSNRSTITDRAVVCDASTVTCDWWSPIVEKKDCKKDIHLEKKKADIVMLKDKGKKSMKNRGIMTEGRIVTFRSRAQIIPSSSFLTIADILSPSRYLLESQKYYNELFSSKVYSTHVFPVCNGLKRQKLEHRLPVSSRHQSRRGRRMTKRLEECYTRKQGTPRKKHVGTSKTSDSFQ